MDAAAVPPAQPSPPPPPPAPPPEASAVQLEPDPADLAVAPTDPQPRAAPVPEPAAPPASAPAPLGALPPSGPFVPVVHPLAPPPPLPGSGIEDDAEDWPPSFRPGVLSSLREKLRKKPGLDFDPELTDLRPSPLVNLTAALRDHPPSGPWLVILGVAVLAAFLVGLLLGGD